MRIEKTIRNDDVKVGRNDPCPCGSGLKYKHCCLKEREQIVDTKPEGKPILKNTFRDELAKGNISDADLLKRDKFIMFKQLQAKKILHGTDRKHFEDSLAVLKALEKTLELAGDCEGKEPSLINLKVHIGNLQKQVEASKLPRQEEISLLMLEEEFGGGQG